MNQEEPKKQKIIQYGLELDKRKLPRLVREKTFSFDEGEFLSPAIVDRFCRKCLRLDHKAEEKLFLFCLSASGTATAIFCSELSSGTSTATLANEKGLATRLALTSASNFIIAHCHPSGSIIPSREDESVAKHIQSVADLLGIRFLDFMIIGGNQYYSFAENHLLS